MTNLLKISKVKFPIPANININMLPFIIGDEKSIPVEYRHYYKSLIESCPVDSNELGKVGYLTITESLVKKGTSQRRPGIHTDGTKIMGWGSGWGGGKFVDGKIAGGIYLASSVENSCRAWNVHIDDPGHLGDCEHLLDSFKNEQIMDKDELFWMTDRCPHESISLTKTTYRQFFRFVTSQVSVWFAKHSTPNYLGIMPNCEIILDSKFE